MLSLLPWAAFWTHPIRILARLLANSLRGSSKSGFAQCIVSGLQCPHNSVCGWTLLWFEERFDSKSGVSTFSPDRYIGYCFHCFLSFRRSRSICDFYGNYAASSCCLVVPFKFVFTLGFWNSARKDQSWGKLGLFSIAVFAVTLISGIVVNSDYRGLLERISIGSTLVLD